MSVSHPTIEAKTDDTSRWLLDCIANKWTVLVLTTLAGGPKHFLALQRCIGGISRKVLTQSLRGLERDGLVVRRPSDVASHVEYSLSPLAETLCPLLDDLRAWAAANVEAVKTAQVRFDGAGGRSDATVMAESRR